jgi:glyoxylase-like metal-dependent hydrolase (beta-lactamase superfamily II)
LANTLEDDGASGKPQLEYPYEAPPDSGATLDVAPGVRWIRMPLPYALDHVNLWAIDEGNGCAVIDTGLNNEETVLAWRTILNDSDKGIGQVTRVLVTHMHADHVGLVGWLTEMSDSELWMTRLEYLTCRLTFSEGKSPLNSEAISFYRCAGWSEMAISALEVHTKRVAACVCNFPGNFRRLYDGQILQIGAHAWTVIVGAGHSPEHACFYCPNLKVLISGDQVLPKISSNISVLPTEPDADPMADWYASLSKLKKVVPDDVLVLPSHNSCFRGLHARIDYLLNSQDRTLKRLRASLQQPKRAIDVFRDLFQREIREADASTLRMATGESIACLNHLLHLGAVKKELGGDGVAWYSVTCSESNGASS